VVPSVLCSTLIGAANGYVFSKWKFPGSEVLFSMLLPYCGKKIIAGIRPEHISCGLMQRDDADTIEVVECRVDVLEPTGPDTLLFVGLNDKVVTSRVRPDEVKPVGEIKNLDHPDGQSSLLRR